MLFTVKSNLELKYILWIHGVSDITEIANPIVSNFLFLFIVWFS